MIPDGWKAVPFADIADYRAGRTPARANSDFWAGAKGGIPWVAISDMTEFGHVTDTKEKITEAAFEQVFKGEIVPAGTLIMSFKLTIGRIATLGIDACHNEAIISIYPRSGVDQRYLGYFLSQVDYSALQDRQVKGNTLNREKIDRIEVWLPPSEEQSAIADVLDIVRHSIELQDSLLATAESLKRSAMRELFTRGLRGEPQKETDIGSVPESWEVTTFKAIREWLQYGTSTRCAKDRKPYPVLRIPNIDSGRVNDADLKYCDLPNEEAKKYRLEAGDIIFIRTNGVLERLGTCAVYEGSPENALFASYLIRARLKQGVDSRFVAFFYGSELGTSLIADRATPAADGKYNLNTGIIDSLPIALPSTLDEQHEIVSILDAIAQKIDLHRKKRAVLEELFKALLHKLMTGEIRVDELDLSALEGAGTDSGEVAA